MKNTKKAFAVLLTICLLVSSIVMGSIPAGAVDTASFDNDNELLLWYRQSARSSTLPGSMGSLGAAYYGDNAEANIWQQNTLPIGNGYMGATIFGEIGREEIVLNEESMWTGGPSTSRPDYNGGNLDRYSVWQQVVQAFKDGASTTEINNLCNQLVGLGANQGYGNYQCFGNLYMDFGFNAENASNYIRALDLKTATSTVDFDYDGVHYKREYFMSYPDHVMAVKLTSDKKNAITCKTTMRSAQNGTVTSTNNVITVKGAIADNQLKYNGQVKVMISGGTQAATSDGGIQITGANEVVMFLSIATDYLNDYPSYRTGENDAQVNQKVADRVNAAAIKGYDAVLADHLEDYTELFDRVDLDIGQIPSDIPTDELLAQYKSGSASTQLRRALEVMLFQYGRYLTIAASREGSLPSNLQGVWNVSNSPAWGSDYHININLQLNYSPTYSTNLAECAPPLIDYVDSLREPGRVTAEKYFGITSKNGEENGFTAHTQNTIFGWTCPGWQFSWGWSPAGMPWILQNCYEYYEFTGDVDYLRTKIYPMLREQSKLYNQILTWDEEGQRYVTAPAYSPEHGPYTFGNTYESTLVWQLFEDTINSAELLGLADGADAELISQIRDKQSKLKPIEIGEDGQIKEWFGDAEGQIGKTASGEDISGYDKNHRHLSQMLGLFPGDLVKTNPDWVKAARVSMEHRPDQTTGWGMGQRINTWARLNDGDKALELIQYLFASGIYNNLWDAHAPFQIDGNYAMTSGVAEMLLQSNMGYVDILPAIPAEWSSGSYEGLVARGNFEVSTSWKFGKANNITILSNNGGECIVNCDGIGDKSVVTDAQGKAVSSSINDDGMLVFDTKEGETYTISGFDQVTPTEPENVDAVIYRDNSVEVSWNYIDGVTYKLTKVAADGTETVVSNSIEAGSYNDKLNNNVDATGYEYKVTAVYSGKSSEAVSVTPEPLSTMVEIDRTGMTATACSQYTDTVAEGADGPAQSVLDGNVGTWWHTHYGNDTSLGEDHHWIEIDLKDTYNLSAISYLPRQNNPNGRILNYNLIITKPDGTEETVITNGSLADDISEKMIVLPHAVQAKKVKIKVTNAKGDKNGTHTTAAEIRFFESELVKLGDVDASGVIDAQDVTKLQKEITHYTVNDYYEPYADVNGDGNISIKDATFIQKAIVGLVEIEDDNPYL